MNIDRHHHGDLLAAAGLEQLALAQGADVGRLSTERVGERVPRSMATAMPSRSVAPRLSIPDC